MPIEVDLLDLPDEIANEVNRLGTTYDFEKLSDKGQNGYLFMAHNNVLNRRVAIKFYFWADGTRAHIEPQSLAAVESSNVIEVFDASLVGDEWAMFVTPYCEYGDVDRYRESNRFGLREAIRFAAGLLDGVASLHQQGFVHRDLKPENLLVSTDRQPLIADFGSVRIIPEGRTTVPGSGHAVLYRPPESFSTRVYDRRGDLYQCGMVLYQILGGRLPYAYHYYLNNEEREEYKQLEDGYDRSRLIERAISRRAESASLLNLKSLPFFVPTSVKTLIKRATNPNPDLRFQSASDFMNKLNTLAGKVVDWQYNGSEPIALYNGTTFRIRKFNGRFIAEQDKGKGWRRIPRLEPGTLRDMTKEIKTRCLR